MPDGLGWKYDRASDEWRPDRLAKLEQWAAENADRMDAERTEKLQRAREEYANVSRALLQEMQDGREFLAEWAGAWAKEQGFAADTVRDCLYRLKQQKLVQYDYAGPHDWSGTWWHWYTITEKGLKDANRIEVTEEDERALLGGGIGAREWV